MPRVKLNHERYEEEVQRGLHNKGAKSKARGKVTARKTGKKVGENLAMDME